MKAIYKYIIEQNYKGNISQADALKLIDILKEGGTRKTSSDSDIAIVGMSAATSMSHDTNKLWHNLKAAKDCVIDMPASRKKDVDMYFRFLSSVSAAKKGRQNSALKKTAYLEEIDKFDYKFFNFSPREADLMDPNHRIFLQTAWKAIEDAGQGGSLANTKTGLFLGFAANSAYQQAMSKIDNSFLSLVEEGNRAAVIPGRVSYLLNVHGPSLVIDTACSSSLVSLHLACKSIQRGECDQAIVGSIKLNILPLSSNHRSSLESQDGFTRSFDNKADGTNFGEGVAAVFIKTLKDAIKHRDNIYAVIKGSAINHDGRTVGIAAPSALAQEEVLVSAWQDANINPETISMIETHGTGTKLGDPIEIEGIIRSFQRYTRKKQFCRIGSIKTNIGHTAEAAGLFGLIKAVLALKNKEFPPSMYFHEPNHEIDWSNSPVYINTKLKKWKARGNTNLRCGVSSFGISGTNCHVVLEEAPIVESKTIIINNLKHPQPNILTLSAKTVKALERTIKEYQRYLRDQENKGVPLGNICYTAQSGREHYNYRLAIIVKNRSDLSAKFNEIRQHHISGENIGKIKDCYYGYHELTPIRGRKNKKFEIKESKLKQISEKTQITLNECAWRDQIPFDDLRGIANAYIRGANLDWKCMYGEEIPRKVSLPTYPFERTRSWIDTPIFVETASGKDIFYHMVWQKEPLPKAVRGKPTLQGTTLVIASKKNSLLVKAIRINNKPQEVIQMIPSRKKYGKLIKDISNKDISKVIFARERGVVDFFHFVKAINKHTLQNNNNNNIDIVLLTKYADKVTGREETIYPEAAAMIGLGKAINYENPRLKCRSIDMDGKTDINSLIHEINTPYSRYKVAYRNNARYTEVLEKLDIDKIKDKETEIKKDNTYCLTGGAGGMGMEMAKYLAGKAKVNIALINRSKLPPRRDWDKILSRKDLRKSDNKLQTIIKTIREIEKTGSKVTTYSADVADRKQLTKVINDIKRDFDKISGVIHVAGINKPGAIVKQTTNDFLEVLTPKVQGTRLLHDLTKSDKLDFFINMSSVITVISGRAAGAYTAANSYLNSFAAQNNILSVNWPNWQDVGLSKNDQVDEKRQLFKIISPDEAIKGLERALYLNITGALIIGELNYQSKIFALDDYLPFDLSAALQKNITEQRLPENEPIIRQYKRVKLRGGNKNEDYSAIEKEIADIWQFVLGHTEIDISDNFFEIGGDSLQIIKVHERLEKMYPNLNIAQLFSYPTIRKLAGYISRAITTNDSLRFTAIHSRNMPADTNDIAITGIALRTSLADTVKQFWLNLKMGRDCIIEIPKDRKRDLDQYIRFRNNNNGKIKGLGKPEYLRSGYIGNISTFDYSYFNMSPKEAELMDPSHRLFLETAYMAIDNASETGKLKDTKTGLYLGFSANNFYRQLISEVLPGSVAQAIAGNTAAIIPSRISHFLNLTGPSMVTDTTCSSALVSTHLAIRAIRNGDCEQAIVGGIKINFLPLKGRSGIGIESHDGYTRSFDNSSDGTNWSEGIAAVFLKPLSKSIEDKNNIYAVIKGSAINQDGQSVSITAPNAKAEEDVILSAWQDAQIDPKTISYIEAHGTGTKLGDPIEIEGITRAFRGYTKETKFCCVGSVKSNIGHTAEVAGLFGLIKAALALKHKQIPPSIHFNEPNQKINWNKAPVYINTRLEKWKRINKDTPLRCGVSSFGLSGTNAHVVLEEIPANITKFTISGPSIKFKKTKCWINIPSFAEAVADKPEVKQNKIIHTTDQYIHPLIEKCLSRSIDQDIYETDFNADKHFALNDHMIRNKCLLPGTVYIEIARQLGFMYFKSNLIELKNVIFHEPVILDKNETRTIQIILKKEQKNITFTVASIFLSDKPGLASKWAIHATGEIYKNDQMPVVSVMDLAELKEECADIIRINPASNLLDWVKFGPRWQGYREIRHSANTALIKLELSDKLTKDLDQYYLHPALMDMANIVISKSAQRPPLRSKKPNIYLPFSYANYKIFGPTPKTMFSYIKKIERSAELSCHDVVLLDVNGKVFGEINGFTGKKIPGIDKLIQLNSRNSTGNFFHHPIWQSAPRSHRQKTVSGAVLALSNNRRFFNSGAFRAGNDNVIMVNIGREYKKENNDNFTITNSQKDYDRLLSDLYNRNILRIIHALTLGEKNKIRSIKDLEKSQERGVVSLLYLIKALQRYAIRNDNDGNIDIALLSNYTDKVTGREKIILPENATLFGLGKAVNYENPCFKCRSVDIDDQTDIKHIVNEINSIYSSYKVAYRDNERFIEVLDKLNINEIKDKKTEIKKGNVYVITGGMGGIGLEMAKYLAGKNKVKIVLINRSKLPSRNKWKELSRKYGVRSKKLKENKIIRIIKTIQEIEKTESGVSIYSTDVANKKQLTKTINQIKKKYQKINGIIHAAGVAGDGFIIKKDEKTFKQVLAPKVQGTYLLHLLTKNDKLDFFINFSSSTSIFSAPGQGDYTAANSYLDSFVKSGTIKARKTITINWGSWKETGMAADHRMKDNGLISALNTDKAVKALNSVLNKDISGQNILIGTLNFDRLQSVKKLPIGFSADMRARADRQNAYRSGKDAQKITPEQSSAIKLKGRKREEEYTETEKKVARIWHEILGYDEIDIDDNFFEIGGDSLLAIQEQIKINNIFNITFPITELFNNTSIKTIARYIETRTANNPVIIQPAPLKAAYRLSYTQKGIWFTDKLKSNSKVFNSVSCLRIKRNINIPQFKAALQVLLDRHEILRTYFITSEENEPMQVVREGVKVKLDIKDFSAMPEEAQNNALTRTARKLVNKNYDLYKDRLYRTALIKLKSDQYILIMAIHHIIIDIVSYNILWKELFLIYDNYNNVTDKRLRLLSIQYKDYAEWEYGEEFKQKMNDQKRYWLKQLGGELPVLNIPTNQPRPSVQKYESSVVMTRVDKELTANLIQAAQQHNVTLFIWFFSIFKIFLHKITGQNDIIVGTPISQRDHAELTEMVGHLFNNIAIRTYPQDDLSFVDYLQSVRQAVLEGIVNKNFSFDRLVDELNTTRDLSRHPIFSVAYNMYNKIDKDLAQGVELTSLSGKGSNSYRQYDLLFRVSLTRENNLFLSLGYDSFLFNQDKIKIFMKIILNIAREILDDPDQKLARINLISRKDKYQLLHTFNNTKASYPKNKTIHQLFEEQIKKTPNRIAVIYENSQLTYQQLNQKANLIASYLDKKYKLKQGDRVALMFDGSVEAIIGMLAALKLGVVYVPININYPDQRIKFVLRDAAAIVLLSHQPLLARAEKLRNSAIGIETIENILGGSPVIRRTAFLAVKAGDPACIFYTSGSTGKPKGVIQTHRGIINNIFTKINYLNINASDLICQNMNYGFAASTWQIYTPLFLGSKIIVGNAEIAKEPNVLLRHINKNNITILELTPSYLKIFVDIIKEKKKRGGVKRIKTVILTGEELPVSVVNDFFRISTARIFNAYGPTEYTDDALYFELKPGKKYTRFPLGKPALNTEVYVLSNDMSLTPPTQIGEMYISGDGLALGYLNLEHETKAVFLPHPFKRGKIIYKTGDLAKVGTDNRIYFSGRADRQVQIRGNRVELGEVEAVLKTYSNIKDIVAEYVPVKEEKVITAYFIKKTRNRINLKNLELHIRAVLPDYMVPAHFIELNKFPINENGKLDRSALPEPSEKNLIRKKHEPPQSPIEQKLAQIWQEVLGVKKISRHDNFFNLGGHSLKAISLLSRLNKEFKIDLPLKNIFLHPVLSDLAQNIDKRKKTTAITIPIATKKKYYPLSHAQKRMWVLYKLESESPFYNIKQVRSLSGNLNIPAFKKSLQALIIRHESLRANFKEISPSGQQSSSGSAGQPAQIIHSRPRTNLKIIDLSKIKDNIKKQENIKEIIKKQTQISFKLETEPLLRAIIIKEQENRKNPENNQYTLIIVMHHIISDGWSMNIFYRELIQFYNGYLENKEPKLEKLPIQYKDYAVWEQSKENENRLKKQEKYWLNQLRGELPILNLPIDKPRPPIQAYNGAVEHIIINATIAKKIKKLCQQRDITLFAFLLTAFNIFLHRLTGQNDIIVGTPSTDRNYTETENIIGFITNTLMIRSDLRQNMPFLEFLKQTKANILEIFNHKDYPFEKIVEKLNPTRDMSRSPLFNVLFQLFNKQMFGNIPADFKNINIRYKYFEQNTVLTDFRLIAVENRRELTFRCEYNTDLFHQNTIKKFLWYYQVLLKDILAYPDKKIAKISILPQEEKNKLIHTFNQTKTDYPKNKTIHQLFEEQVKKSPKRTAVEYENSQLTYSELNQKANQLAYYLREKHHIKPDQPVGILLDRSLEMIISILAVLKAGGYYLPLDPEYPAERIKYMIRNSNAAAVLTQKKYTKHLARFPKLKIIRTDDKSSYSINTANLTRNTKSTNLAYVIYTSGSTGNPKGVMIEHRSAVNFITGICKDIKFNSKDKILFSTTLSFDISFLETVLPLTGGMSIVIAGEEEKKDPGLLGKLIINKDINIIQMTPPAIRILVDDKLGRQSLKNLRKILIGGDMLTDNLLAKVQKITKAKIYNMYGPAETTIWSAYKNISKDSKVTIGAPLANTQLYILDKNRYLLPIGIPGELYVSGHGLARGYINDKKKTDRVFLPHPFLKGQRIYKTGDEAKMHPDGNIEILGRVDQQIKIGGFRIEPGEIEAHIKKHHHIKEVVVIAYPDKKQPTDKHLAAYYTATKKVNAQKLKDNLKKHLPDYMIPQYFIYLTEMPLTPSGKLDRNNLPEPKEKDLIKQKYDPPQDSTEQKLAQIWQDILNVKKVSRHDNFFDLGGHSLKAIDLVSKINKEFKIDLPLKEVFLNATIQELASVVEKMTEKKQAKRITIPRAKPRKYYPLTKFQHVIWMAGRSVNQTFLNFPIILKFHGRFKVDVLEKALQEIINRHEGLRSNYWAEDDKEMQKISKNKKITIDTISIAGKKDKNSIIPAVVKKTVNKKFNLKNDLLLRATIIQINKNVNLLILVSHKIIFDRESRFIMLEEISLLYKHFLDHSAYPLDTLPVKYTDYILWENKKDVHKQEKYWLNKFSDKYPVVIWPKNLTKKALNSAKTDYMEILKISPESAGAIEKICRKKRITPFMFYMAALKILLYKLAGQADLMVGAVVSRRDNGQIRNIIAPLINTLAFRSKVNPNEIFADFLDQIKTVVTEALANADIPFSCIVEKNKISLPAGGPPTNVFFELHHVDDNDEIFNAESGLKAISRGMGTGNIPFDLEVAAIIRGNKTVIRFSGNPRIFKNSAIKSFIKQYDIILKQVITDLDIIIGDISNT